MDAASAIIAFSVAAGLLTVTPGLDTALVLRTAAVEGSRSAMRAGAGVVTGVLVWGAAASLGLGALIAVSSLAYRLLQYAGAAYLVWLGMQMLAAAWRGRSGEGAGPQGTETAEPRWFWRGLLTNLLNPKVGVFYLSFLPQFIPADMPVAGFGIALAAIHAAMGLGWFALLTLAFHPFGSWLRNRQVLRSLDGLTGGVLLLFGLRLALAPRG